MEKYCNPLVADRESIFILFVFVFFFTGTFYGMVSYLGSTFTFKSRNQIVTGKSCFSLFYLGYLDSFEFEINYLDDMVMNKSDTVFSDNYLMYSSDIWKPAQVRLHIFAEV